MEHLSALLKAEGLKFFHDLLRLRVDGYEFHVHSLLLIYYNLVEQTLFL
jgi:hypothetical protein